MNISDIKIRNGGGQLFDKRPTPKEELTRFQYMSKHFKEHEIIGYLTIDGRKVTYLKPHVKRLYKYPETEHEDYVTHLNQDIIALQRYANYLKTVVGIDDFDEKLGRYEQ